MKTAMQDPNFWRERAEETRVKAESFGISKDQKQRLLRIAEEYEQLAERAKEWQLALRATSELQQR